jgi:hypothetical protein
MSVSPCLDDQGNTQLTYTAKKGADLSLAIPRFYKKDQADWGKKVVDAVSASVVRLSGPVDDMQFQPSALFTDVKLQGVFLNFTLKSVVSKSYLIR